MPAIKEIRHKGRIKYKKRVPNAKPYITGELGIPEKSVGVKYISGDGVNGEVTIKPPQWKKLTVIKFPNENSPHGKICATPHKMIPAIKMTLAIIFKSMFFILAPT